VSAVDHDLRHRVVGEQLLQRAVPDGVVGDLVQQPIAVGASDPLLLLQQAAHFAAHPPPHLLGLDLGLEQNAPEVRDHRLMDPVLELGERVHVTDWRPRRIRREALVQLHQPALQTRMPRRRRPFAVGAPPLPLTSPARR
jgi:hypothetical protein